MTELGHEYDLGLPLVDGLEVYRHFAYTDNKGARTERKVTVESIYGPSLLEPTYIRGICHAADAARTFAVRRIESFIDPGTGEGGDPTKYIRVMVARAKDIPLVCSARERIDLVAALHPEIECVTREGEAFNVRPTIVRAGYGRLGFRGSSRREAMPGKRAWTGTKTFYPDMLSSWRLVHPTEPEDLIAWLQRLAMVKIELPPPDEVPLPTVMSADEVMHLPFQRRRDHSGR